MAIAWDPSLSIGVDAIDAQHRELFARLDRLLEASASRTTAKEVGAMLEFLGEYVREHFVTEEELMDALAYPDAEEHRAEHAAFTKELAGLRAAYEQEGGTAVLVVKVTRRTTEWLRDHIYRTDRRLGLFAAERRRPAHW